MNYFNYFEECGSSKSRSGSLDMKQLGGLFVGVIVICALVYGFFAIKLSMINRSISKLEEMEANEAFANQYRMAGVLSDQLAAAEKYLSYLELLDDSVITFNTGNKELFDIIDACMTGGYLTTVNVEGLSVTVEGNARTMDVISDIERKFREQPHFSAVNVTSFAQEGDGGAIAFSVSLALKGGAVRVE